MTTATKKSTMAIWNQVCVTDTAKQRIKAVKLGARAFTAIDAQGQIKTATEMWGPYGQHWGVRGCVYTPIGESITDGVRVPVAMMLAAEFYAPEIAFGLTVDRVYKPNDEVCKKMLTDLTTKALSRLGFNSDVFEGAFDACPHSQPAQRQPAQRQPEQRQPEQRQQAAAADDGGGLADRLHDTVRQFCDLTGANMIDAMDRFSGFENESGKRFSLPAKLEWLREREGKSATWLGKTLGKARDAIAALEDAPPYAATPAPAAPADDVDAGAGYSRHVDGGKVEDDDNIPF